MPFLQEPEPPRGVPLDVLPGIRRIIARNPSVMTYHGTNTYLIDGEDGLTILDPGPADDRHVEETIRAAAGVPVRRIVLTHSHGDHSGAVPSLQAETGAPVYMYKTSFRPSIKADVALDEADTVAGLRAVFTPGHAADHLAFEFHVPGTGQILFTGDHVMSWSSSIVSPPDGNMLDYYRSLEALLARDDVLYLGGHGPLLREPRILTAELLAHRQYRETTMLNELRNRSWSIRGLAAKLYHKTDPFLKAAATRNVLAHMQKLVAEGIVDELPDPEPAPDDEVIPNAPPGGEVEDESGDERATMIRDASRRFAMRS